MEDADFTMEPGERVCLLGRNGTGKTTLLRLIHGEIEPDRGEVVRQQGLVTAMLPQEVPRGLGGTVFDKVSRGLGSRADLLAEYHHVSGRLAAEDRRPARLTFATAVSRISAFSATQLLNQKWKPAPKVRPGFACMIRAAGLRQHPRCSGSPI